MQLNEQIITVFSSALPLIVGLTALLAAFVFLSRGRIKFGALQFDFERRARETILKEIKDDVAQGSSPQAALMREYHAQGLSQSKISFWFSLIFASLGFAIIALSIGLFLQNTGSGESWIDTAAKPIFTLVAGAIIDAVAALFFVQSNKARELMVEFFDKLRNDRKLDEALALMSDIDDVQIAAKSKSLISLSFAGVSVDKNVLDALFPAAPPFESAPSQSVVT
ncbi:TRADD-N-associated membrane domain-containing protein [Rhizobium fabae]|uniref:Cyanobacterial TRADD-N associated 2 transmembrane domain-containing protein n=1 Tax=Rhizobium fabae TaxID=573179 RepID=A0A7W6B8H7_9HYPH|nr:hypothetical protein [Rhizobium fabae]MBB3914132.1 hypothetical protein [Rhizobium fabae]RUM16076.1 hypothetical protein EFB14_01720 [Rhizobium fabae]